MVTIARICEKMIEQKPFLQEALSNEIINYGALAETMIPDVEREFGKKIKHAAVMMALRRLQEKLQKMPISQPKFTADCDLSVRSDLFEITIVRYPQTYKLINKFYDLAGAADYLTVTSGTNEITIVAAKKYRNAILKLVQKEDILVEINDLAALTVKLPKNAPDMPGIFYLISRALTWENITIVEVVSTYTENTIILKNKDISRAYEILQKTIKENS